MDTDRMNLENEMEMIDPANIETGILEGLLLKNLQELKGKIAFLEKENKELEEKNIELFTKNNLFKKYLNRYQIAYYSFAQMACLESARETNLTHSQRRTLAEVRNMILHELGIELSNMKESLQEVDDEIDPIPF